MTRTMLLAATLLLCLAAKKPAHVYQPVSLVKEEYKLNSASRPGGVTRQVVTLNIPPLTEYVYYSVSVSPKGALEPLNLHAKLT